MRFVSSMWLSLLLLLVSPLLTSCTSTAPDDAAITVQQQPNRMLRRRRTRFGFYEVRRDLRSCPSPSCGGYFVRPINGSLIKCPGAKKPTAECYVGTLRYEETTPSPGGVNGTTIVYGHIVPEKKKKRRRRSKTSHINDFVVQDGTTAATKSLTLSYSVQQDSRDGLFPGCLFPQCGGFFVKALATTKTLCSDGTVADACYVVGLNLTGLGLMPEEEVAVLAKVISDGGPVKGYYIDNPNYDNDMMGSPELKDLFVIEAN